MGARFIGNCKAIIGGKEYTVKNLTVSYVEPPPEYTNYVPVFQATYEFEMHYCVSHRVKDGGMVMLRHLDGSYCTRPKSCRKFHDWQWQGVGDG